MASLRAQDFPVENYEVIFVDDSSSDGTFELLQKECGRSLNWRVLRTAANSGAPSQPRNMGVSAARGEYVFFLDCDDCIAADTLRVHYSHALTGDYCIVRGYLVVNDGKSLIDMNKMSAFDVDFDKVKRIERIIRSQSTTVPSLIKRDVLVNNGILWNESLRMGEDTVFLIDVLAACERIGYIDHSTFVYNKAVSRVASSTRVYGARELRNHLDVWELAEHKLGSVGLSYVGIRFHVGLQTVLQALIRYNTGDIDRELFARFSRFVSKHWTVVSNYKLNSRLSTLLAFLRVNDYFGFFAEARPRLLIAGFDLKFILGVIPTLSEKFNVRVDEWVGHDEHDTAASRELLDWAEIIFCEWLLGNAVWYSQHKRKDQRLVVRAHRFDLSREFGNLVNDGNVDLYVAVSVLYVERLLESFNLDRTKVRLLANHVGADGYCSNDNDSRVFNLALVGSLPARKGLMKALELLSELVLIDERYNLSIYGKGAHETPWILRDTAEFAYFQRCDEFIEEKGLSDYVHFCGYVDVTKELADVGFVLSVSDDEHLPESFHIAPSDGFAAGGQGLLLDWSGVEYVYPAEFIFSSLEDMKSHIVRNSDYGLFKSTAGRGREFIAAEYAVPLFVKRLSENISDLL